MSTSTRTLVTANLERGRPQAWDWLQQTLDQRRPAVIFGQELAGGDRLVTLAAEHGYEIVWPATELDPRWQVVSWVMVDRALTPRPATDPAMLARLGVHGSYAAAACVDWRGLGPLTLVSMHASPRPVPVAEVKAYPAELGEARHGGDGVADSGRYFYSDLMLDALSDAATRGPILAAGDLNEARKWDDRNRGHSWGREFFDPLPDRGLRDVTYDLWDEERQTRFHPTHPDYQLDVVLASPSVATKVVDAEVDAEWTPEEVAARGLADHAPLWFTVKSS